MGKFRLSRKCLISLRNKTNGNECRKITKPTHLSLNTWPTCEHGIISSVPPHCQMRKDISRFSPPHTSIDMSNGSDQDVETCSIWSKCRTKVKILIKGSIKQIPYVPSSSKNCLSMEKRPPAMVGERTGAAALARRASSAGVTWAQLKSRVHVNTWPMFGSEAKVSCQSIYANASTYTQDTILDKRLSSELKDFRGS